MSDIKKVNEQTDALLEAMEYIAEAKVRSIQMAKIDTVTIVDDSEAAEGIYKVSNGSATYVAYSDKDDYKKDDNVQIVIPNEGYNEQKTIIGKVITKKSTPMTYKAPFDYFLDMTGNLVGGQSKEVGLLANYVVNNADKKLLAFWSCIGSPSEKPLAGFETLGVRADFMSLLSNFNTVTGNYGLLVTVKAMKDAENAAVSSQMLEDLESVEDSSVVDESDYDNYFVTREYVLDVNDMYGDPYDFDTYYNQEAIFDVSDLGPIVSFTVEFFQEKNDDEGSFRDTDGELIPYHDDVFDDELLMDNLYCKDLYLGMGYDETKFDGDKLVLYTRNNLSYSSLNTNAKNKKTVYARWIHKDETGEILIIDDLSKVEGSAINWYYFKQNASADDKLSGVQWAKIFSGNDFSTDTQHITLVNDWECFVVPNTDLQQERIKAILTYNTKVLRSNEITFINEVEVPNQTNIKQFEDFYFEFLDNSNGVYYKYGNDNKIILEQSKQGEIDPSKVQRGLVLKLQQSDVQDIEFIKWTFPSEYTMVVPTNSTGTKILGNKFAWDREIDGGYIHYDVYDNHNGTWSMQYPGHDIDYDMELAKIEQHRQADPDGYGELYYQRDLAWLNEDQANINAYKAYDNNYIYNPEEIISIPNFDYNFYYKIDNLFIQSKTKNIITCEIIKDRIHYSYSVELKFGPANTNGSPYTLVASFIPLEPGKIPNTAMRATNGSKLNIQLDIIDEYGHYLDWKNATLFSDVQVKWEWAYVSAPLTTINQTAQYSYKELDPKNIPQYRKATSNTGIYDPYTNKNYVAISDINHLKDDDNNSANDVLLNPVYYSDQNGTVATEFYNTNTTYYTRHRMLGWKANDGTIIPLHINFSTDNGNTSTTSSSVLTTGAGEDKHKICLVATNNISLNELYVLKMTVTGFINYPLITYLPIPLYQEQVINNRVYKPIFVGPDMVRYDSAGNIVYYQDPCYLEWIDLGPTDAEGESEIPSDVTEDKKFVTFNIFAPETDLINGVDVDWDKHSDLRVVNSTHTKYILRPAAYYSEDWIPHGIQAGIIDEHDVFQPIYWTQPIFYYENNYPNGTVNKWDGQGTVINDEEGYILTHSVVAGKKEDDNTFTGVMLGDLGGSQDNLEVELSKQTGIYGFHHGAISYALKEDGTMYLGKSGRGRIYLDGNEGVITSFGFLQHNPYNRELGFPPSFAPSNHATGSLTADRYGNDTLGPGVRIDLDSAPYLYIRGRSDQNNVRDILYINDDNGQYDSFLQSASYDDADSPYGFKINLTQGWIDSYGKFTLTSKEKGSRVERIRLSTTAPYLIIRDINNVAIAYFDGENYDYLQSGNYNYSSPNGKGLLIDLTNGNITAGGQLTLKNYNFELHSDAYNGSNTETAYIKFKNSGTDQIIISTTTPYFVVKDRSAHTLVNIAEEGYYLRSADYSDTAGTNIDLAGGTITSHEFKLKAGTSPKYIIINSAAANVPFGVGTFSDGEDPNYTLDVSNTTLFNTTRKVFRVNWNGEAIGTRARFGGWQFYEGDGAPVGSGSGYWQTFYSNLASSGNSYTIFDASVAHETAIAVNVNNANPFNNLNLARFRVANSGEMWTAAAHLGYDPNDPTNYPGWGVTSNMISSNAGGESLIDYDDETGTSTINNTQLTNDDTSFLLSVSNFMRRISGHDNNNRTDKKLTNLRLAIGTRFAVDKDGNLYAYQAKLKGATISGTIAATSGKIGNWTISGGNLTAGNTTLKSDGTISAGNVSIYSTTDGGGRINVGGVILSAGSVDDYGSGLSVSSYIYPTGIVATSYSSFRDGLGVSGDTLWLGSGSGIELDGDYEFGSIARLGRLFSFITYYAEVHGFSVTDAGYAYFA